MPWVGLQYAIVVFLDHTHLICFVHLSNHYKKDSICNRQFELAFTCEPDSDIPSKEASPFFAMDDITVETKEVRLNRHKAPGHDGLNAKVLAERV